MRKPGNAVITLVTTLAVAACSHTEPERARPDLQGLLPPYAVIMGAGAWLIQCPGQTVTITDTRNPRIFYKDDGTQKTRREFCVNYDSGSRVRRG